KKQQREPAAQKPIMTLPLEAIRGAKAGSSAPLEQFTKQQDRKRKEKEKEKAKEKEREKELGKKPAARRETETAEPLPLLAKAGHRDRRKTKSRDAIEEESVEPRL